MERAITKVEVQTNHIKDIIKFEVRNGSMAIKVEKGSRVIEDILKFELKNDSMDNKGIFNFKVREGDTTYQASGKLQVWKKGNV